MVLRYLWYTLLLFCIKITLLSAQQSIDLSLLPTSNETFSLTEELVKQPCVLEKLSFSSDTAISEKELRYRAGLKEGSRITAEEIKRACWHFKRKNKFE